MLLLGAAGLLMLGALVAVAVLLSGVMSTAATKQHLKITHRILDAGLTYSVRANSDDIALPALDDPAMIAQGLACFQRHCADCHGAPGIAPGAAALGMMPVPTNLAGVAAAQTPQWLYYVTSKGVRMTGMPAWEFRLDDRALWATVAFLKTLPALTVEEYGMRAKSATPLACEGRRDDHPPPIADGAVVMRQYACHACHVIQGVVGPDIHVGPKLERWPTRASIAGGLPNTPANLVRFIRAPQSHVAGSLMPDLGVTEADARVMADFLFAQR
jgi:mono/diheme cytochrome c family protein